MGLLLLIVSIFLLIPISVIGIIWNIIESIWNRKLGGAGQKLNKYFLSLAISIDMLGNVLAQELLNDALIFEGGYKFGIAGETISSALGKNERDLTLTVVGTRLANLLNKIDNNHCANSINDCI